MKIFFSDTPSGVQEKSIPPWIIWSQCVCFFILYAVWGYPNTNFLTDLLIIIGALFSIYIFYLNHYLFKAKRLLPIWLMIMLIVWIIFHLFFLSNNFNLQLREFESIWKRVIIVTIFGLGFGVSIAQFQSLPRCLIIIYVGMTFPGLIYIFKYILRFYAIHYNLL